MLAAVFEGNGQLAVKDVPEPTISALGSKGRKGRAIRLLSRVSDDSGEVSVVEEIKLGRKVVARLKPVWFSAAARSKTVAVAWKAPKTASGAYQHCVRAVDRAGNSSPASCARIALK